MVCDKCGVRIAKITILISDDPSPNRHDFMIDVCKACAVKHLHAIASTIKKTITPDDSIPWTPATKGSSKNPWHSKVVKQKIKFEMEDLDD